MMQVELTDGTFEERLISHIHHDSSNKNIFNLPKQIPVLKEGEKIVWRVGYTIPLIINY